MLLVLFRLIRDKQLKSPYLLTLILIFLFTAFSGCAVQNIRDVKLMPKLGSSLQKNYITNKMTLPSTLALVPLDRSALEVKGSDENVLQQIGIGTHLLTSAIQAEFQLLPYQIQSGDEVAQILQQESIQAQGILSRREIVKLCEKLGVEGLVTGEVSKLSNVTAGLYAATVLKARLWFWNDTGQLLWTAEEQTSFRGGIFDAFQVVELVANQVENSNYEKAYNRQAVRLAKNLIQSFPRVSHIQPAESLKGSDVKMSDKFLVLPFADTNDGQTQGSQVLSHQLASALARQGFRVDHRYEVEQLFSNEPFRIVALPRWLRRAETHGYRYVVVGQVEKWNGFYALIHSHVNCAFQVQIWDTRTGRKVFSDSYEKMLAAGLIKAPSSIGSAAVAPLLGVRKSRAVSNAYDLTQEAAQNIQSWYQLAPNRSVAAQGVSFSTPALQ